MSNKNYKSYNNYSSTKPAEEVVEPVEVKEEVKVEEPTPVVEEVKPEPTPAPVVEEPKPVVKPEPPKPLTGKVTGCAKLNVRESANATANVLAVINEGSEVVINRIKSTVEFYAVCTAAGIEGYCMKKFITPIK